MPVSVSLFDLVLVGANESDHLWPEQFVGLLAKIEEDGVTDAQVQWGALADLCQEYDEPKLERGFRWLMARPAVRVAENKPYGTWSVVGAPKVIEPYLESTDEELGAGGCIAEAVARLVCVLEQMDAAIK